MRLFLQINIGHWKDEDYLKPMLSFASSLADDLVGTDVDSESEQEVIDLVKKLIGQAQQIFLLAYVSDPGQPLKGVLSLVNDLFSNKEKIHLAVLSGEHVTLEKLLRVLDEKFVKNNEDALIRKMIKQFARG